MKDIKKIEKLGLTSEKQFEEVKRDYKECKQKVDKLEMFLTRLVKGFQSEYNYN